MALFFYKAWKEKTLNSSITYLSFLQPYSQDLDEKGYFSLMDPSMKYICYYTTMTSQWANVNVSILLHI